MKEILKGKTLPNIGVLAHSCIYSANFLVFLKGKDRALF